MKRIIEEVLEAEEKISADLKQARQKATEIVKSAEKEISEKMADTREKARGIIQSAIEEAKKEAEFVKRESLKEADREKEALLKSNADKIDTLVDDVSKIILTTEANRNGE
jgi:F0F1-type ATP synthase membrane subunit b/b'